MQFIQDLQISILAKNRSNKKYYKSAFCYFYNTSILTEPNWNLILIINISSYWISILYGPFSFIPKRLASSYNCIPLVYSDNNISIVYYLVFLCVTNLNSQNTFSFLQHFFDNLSIPLYLFYSPTFYASKSTLDSIFYAFDISFRKKF